MTTRGDSIPTARAVVRGAVVRGAVVRAAVLLCALAVTSVRAAPGNAATLALTGATIHPISGPDIVGGSVLIIGDTIAAVGAAVTIPADAEVIHLDGKQIYPGWVAAWSTLGLTEISSVLGSEDTRETGDVNPNIRTDVEFNPESELIPVARANGITSAVAVPGGGAIAGTSALIHLAGWTFEDMTVRAPLALHVQWPNMTLTHAWFEQRSDEQQRKDRDAAVSAITKTFDDARAYWKARAAEGSRGIPRHDRDVKWDAMGKALKGDIPVAFHCNAANQIRAVLHFVDEQKLTKVLLYGGVDATLFVDELKARHMGVVLSGVQELPRHGYEAYDAAYSLPARLSAAGVPFAISDGGGASNERNLPYQAGLAVGFGLAHDDALKAISLWPAQLLGVSNQVGSIEVGKFADLQVTDGDPLEITTHVERVYIKGVATEMSNRQTRLFDKYDHRPRGVKARAH